MQSWIRRGYAIGGLLLAASTAAWSGEHAGRGLAVPQSPLYQQECSGCHVAYPPSMLPAASWQRLMDGLPRHFGVDASLDTATVRELRGWLVANAGSGRRASASPPEDRITQSGWFVREHRKVGAATWSLPAVKSAANCSACHTRAAQGDFDEHAIRIPR